MARISPGLAASRCKVDGGYLVSGRKIFASQSPVGTVLSTMFPFDDPDEGRIVLNMAVPLASDGVTVLETWDAMGMRGTGSHDVELRDVFVPDERVIARRPYGKVDGPLQVILSIAIPAITAVYLGVAEAARDHAVEAVAGTREGRRSRRAAPGRADGHPLAGGRMGPVRRPGRRR